MNVFPASNLPVQSQTWGREVEKRITNLDTAFRAAEVNNVTRDSQLITSYKRLDTAFTQLKTTTEAANAAQDAAIEALNGLGSLDEATSTYKINASNVTLGTLNANLVNVTNINASNITTGSLSADRISGGVIDASDISGVNITGTTITGGSITGANILTASSGTRVDLSGSNIEFFSSSYGGGGPRVGYIQGDDGGSPGLYIISDQGSIALDSTSITLAGDTSVTGELDVNQSLNGTSGSFSGSLSVGGTLTAGSFSPSSLSTGAITASSVTVGTSSITGTSVYGQAVTGDSVGGGNANFTGSISGSSISNGGTYTGNGFPTIRDNTVSGTTTFAPNVFISASTGNMARNTTSSERRAKENIQELEFDSSAFIAINPVTFNYKREAVSDEEQASVTNVGFILDDFEDAGLGEFLVAEPFEGDEYKQLRYNLLYMYLHKVVQEQSETIKSLEARLAALESKVE